MYIFFVAAFLSTIQKDEGGCTVYRNTANKYNDIPFSYISKKIGGGGGIVAEMF